MKKGMRRTVSTIKRRAGRRKNASACGRNRGKDEIRKFGF
jgi:hypothetical protein